MCIKYSGELYFLFRKDDYENSYYVYQPDLTTLSYGKAPVGAKWSEIY